MLHKRPHILPSPLFLSSRGKKGNQSTSRFPQSYDDDGDDNDEGAIEVLTHSLYLLTTCFSRIIRLSCEDQSGKERKRIGVTFHFPSREDMFG